MTNLINTAKQYIEAGLSVLPVRNNKAPTLKTWDSYKKRRASESEIEKTFTGAGVYGIAVIGGNISGGLEVLDFDSGGAVYPDWKERIPPELFKKLTVEKSPHGYHVYFRSNAVEGSAKLANAENNSVLIETRGTGGYCICAPTPGYSLIQGSMLDVQTITPAEREKLMEAAREFNQVKKQRPKKTAPKRGTCQDFSPADYFSNNGDIRAILERNGWTLDGIAADGNERWTRPGKAGGTSGTLKENENGVLLFYPFTTSTGFEANQGYNAFQVLSILEYGGNDSNAARAIREQVDQERRAAVPMKQGAPVPGSGGNVTEIELDATDAGGMEPYRDRESWVDFPLEALPLITRNFVTAAARAINADPATVAIVFLNTMGALIGARLKLRLGGFDWTAAPILWTAIIGISSAGKSPATKTIQGLLRDKRNELARKYADEMNNYKRECIHHQKVLNRIERYNDKAIDQEEEGNEEAAEELRQKAARLEKSKNFKPPKKPAERILEISGGFTLQGLIATAAENPMGFQLNLDELTQFFASLSNSSDKAAASQEFLKGYDGTPSRTAYKNAEENRQAPQLWYSIIGGGVPSVIQEFIKGTQYERDGLLSRFFLIWAPPVPLEQFNTAPMPDEQKKPMKKILETLVDFRPDYNPEIVIDLNPDGSAGDESRDVTSKTQTDRDEKKDPHIEEMYRRPKSRLVNFSPEAMEAFKQKRKDLYSEKLNSSQDAIISLLGKADGVLGRVAVLLHVLGAVEKWIDEMQRPLFPFGLEVYAESHEVSLETFRRAEQITEWLLHETITVYKKMGILADDNDLQIILDKLKKCPDGANTSTIQYWKGRQWRDKAGKVQMERLLAIGLKQGLWTATVQTGGNNRPFTIYRAVKK